MSFNNDLEPTNEQEADSCNNALEISIGSHDDNKRHPISPLEVDIRCIPDGTADSHYFETVTKSPESITSFKWNEEGVTAPHATHHRTTNVATPVQTRGDNHSDDDYISTKVTPRTYSIDTKHYIQFQCHKFLSHAEVIGRILLLVLNILLLTLSTGYCSAQWFGTTLDLVKPCEPKTIEEIWDHSYRAGMRESGELQMTPGSQYGETTEACWTTQALDTNTDLLWYSNVYTPYDVTQPIKNIQTVAFGALIVYYLCISIHNICTLIIDCIYASKRKLHKRSKMYRDFMRQNTTIGNVQSANIESKCRRCARHVSALWSSYMASDTTGWIIACVIFELVEITIQTQALFLYNGYNAMDPRHQNNVYLANESHFIVIFAAILAFNCFGSGALWLMYALLTKYCHGLLFKLFLFWVDQLSDLLYTLYPFILIYFDRNNDDPYNIRVLLSQLNTNSTIIAFISSFIPLVFLGTKSFLITRSAQSELANKYYSHWKFIHDLSKQKDDQQIAYQAKLAGWDLNIAAVQKNNKEIFGSKANLLLTLKQNITKTNWIQTPGQKKVSRKKQCVLVTIAFAYIVYGIAVLLYVLNHVTHAEQHCAMVREATFFENGNLNRTMLSDEQHSLLQRNPELFFWDKCLYKVYPFLNDDTESVYHHGCQCRVLVIDWNQTTSTAYERNTYFNLTQPVILSNMLMHWFQLEKFRTTGKEYTSSLDATQITKSMFVAKHMKAFEWRFAGISCIERGISAWKELEYLKLTDVGMRQAIPNDFGALKSMRYLSFESNGLRTFPDSICNMSSLQVLDIKLETIPSIPPCIQNLTELQQLTVENCINLEHVPLTVFALPNLIILSLFHAKISSQSLIRYNRPNDTDTNDTNEALEWLQNALVINPNIKDAFYLQLNPICNESASWFASVICDYPCDTNAIHTTFCSPRLLGDGKCDDLCDNGLCNSDHGDCVQLCFSPASDCTYDLFANDVCDAECNNKYCVDYHDKQFTDARRQYSPQLVNFAADNYHCVYEEDETEEAILNCSQSKSNYFDINTTRYNVDIPTKCEATWIGDGLCDDICRTDACNHDGGDCEAGTCTRAKDGYLNVCKYIYDAWIHFVGHHTYYVNISYFCGSIYPKGVQLFGADTSSDIWYDSSCRNATQFYDFNDDNCVNFREWTYMAYVFGGGWIIQGKQVNCSECVGMEYYNMDCRQNNDAFTSTIDPMFGGSCEMIS